MITKARTGVHLFIMLIILASCTPQFGVSTPNPSPLIFHNTLTPWVFQTSTLPAEGSTRSASTLVPATPLPTSPVSLRPALPTQSALQLSALPGINTQTDWSRLVELQRWGRGRIQYFELTPDARQIILATQRGISIYDARTLREIRFIEVPAGVPMLALSPDGRVLAVSDWNSIIALYDFEWGSILRKLDNGEHGVPLSLRFLTDGRSLVVGTSDEFNITWDVETGKLVHRWYTTGNSAVAVSPLGDMIATSDWNGSIFMWNGADGRSSGRYWRDSEVQALSFSPDGNQLTAGYGDGKAGVWNLLEAKLQFTLPHNDRVSTLAYSLDGRFIATGSWDNTAHLWRAVDGKELRFFTDHQGRVNQVRFSPDGNTLITLAGDGILRFWQLDTGLLIAQTLDYVGLSQASFGTSGTLASAGDDGSLRLWDISSGVVNELAEALPGGISHLALTKDGKRVAASGMDGTLKTWQLPELALQAEEEVDEGWVSSLALSADGVWLAASAPGRLYMWSLLHGELVWQQETGADTVISLAFTPGNQSLALGTMDGNLALLRVKDGSLAKTLRKEGPFISALDFSRDGLILASGGDAPQISLWRINASEFTETLIVGIKGDRLCALAYSPDGAVIATAWWNKSLRFYNPANGALLHTVALTAAARQVAFSADGKLLALSLEDGTVRVWGIR